MPDFLNPSLIPADASKTVWHIVVIALRLAVAGALGFVVSWIYRQTRRNTEIVASFPTTLVLLCILIAMVTQVIGESVARAFSLVGALSIVRFRTVVRDTQDTAYVIFSVAVGMAVGAQNIWAGLLGILAVGAAAFLLRRPGATRSADEPPFVVSMRVALGFDLARIVGALTPFVLDCELAAIETAKQGAALDLTYETRLKPGHTPDVLVSTLNTLDGIQNISVERQRLDLAG